VVRRRWCSQGRKHVITQTERIGLFLDGALKVIEGRGYDADGKLAFNSFGIVSFNPATRSYSMRSYAGQVGDFVRLTADDSRGDSGWPGDDPHTAAIKGNTLRDRRTHRCRQRTGALLRDDAAEVGDADWPAAGTVGRAGG
jgi:hypothetical protein